MNFLEIKLPAVYEVCINMQCASIDVENTYEFNTALILT